MKKRRLFSLFLSFALLLPLFSLTSADAYEDFDLDAKAGLLIEADTGEILYEKNAHQENFPASLTKVMVALLVFEAIDEGKIALTDSVTATESAFEGLSSDGSTANIVPGETMTVEQLLNCMLIVSANETCNILGEYISGSVEAFVARMNERATELGCEHTHFANATGLHNSQHYTTAWDLYLITREAMKHDKFMEICNSKSYTVPATNMTEKPLERAAKPAGQPCCGGSMAMHIEPIEQHRWTEQFEALRKATDDAAEKTGKRLSAFLVNMGPIPQHKARADFSRGFLEVGGINVIGNDGFECPNCAVKAAVESGADVAVICSTDDTYPELVPAIAKGIKEKAPNMLVMLAGAPAAEFKPSYDEAGVDEYIHVKANCLEILKKIQSERGIG